MKFVDFQRVRCAMVEVGPELQGNTLTIDVPGGSVVEVDAYVTSAFNGTTPTLTVSDGTNTYINGAAITAEGAVDGSKGYIPSNGSVSVTIGGSGSTAGTAIVRVIYTSSQISDGVYSNNG